MCGLWFLRINKNLQWTLSLNIHTGYKFQNKWGLCFTRANGPENLYGLHVMGVLLILHGKTLMCGFVLSYISSAAGVQLSTSSAQHSAIPARLFPWQPNTRFVLVLVLQWERGYFPSVYAHTQHEAFCVENVPIPAFIVLPRFYCACRSRWANSSVIIIIVG